MTSRLISMYQKSSYLSIKYRMLSYLPVGLSAERSYFQRKAHIISFFSSFWSWRQTFFFIKLIKHTSSTKYILNYKKFCQKLFLELNTVRFKIEKNTTEKNGVIFTLSSCVIWCIVLIPVVFPLFDWETCMEWNKSLLFKTLWYFVYLSMNWKSAYLGHFTQILHAL